MKRTRGSGKLSDQVARHASKRREPAREYEGTDQVVSTGSTLLDLAISGGRFSGGGIPGGILVEIFGPASSGKTVLLCELAGAVKQQGGEVLFRDPEGRLNSRFAKLFGLDVDAVDYSMPNTVPEVFEPVRDWKPKPADKIHGVFADSLAALSTEWEGEGKDGMGMRRAKEFSEQCRLTCRTLTQKGFLMVCSNQVRQNLDAGPYGLKYRSPGGEAIGFYSSLRLRCLSPQKIKRKRKIAGKEKSKVIGVETTIEVFKSSVWEPYHVAPIYIIYDYGIDDIRANLRFIKESTGNTVYRIGDTDLGKSIEPAVQAVEEDRLERRLRKHTIDLWREIDEEFRMKRKPKKRRTQ